MIAVVVERVGVGVEVGGTEGGKRRWEVKEAAGTRETNKRKTLDRGLARKLAEVQDEGEVRVSRRCS